MQVEPEPAQLPITTGGLGMLTEAKFATSVSGASVRFCKRTNLLFYQPPLVTEPLVLWLVFNWKLTRCIPWPEMGGESKLVSNNLTVPDRSSFIQNLNAPGSIST